MKEEYKKETCLTCKHMISKAYPTIRCDIWTPKIRNWLKAPDTELGHCIGRMSIEIRCQYYKREED